MEFLQLKTKDQSIKTIIVVITKNNKFLRQIILLSSLNLQEGISGLGWQEMHYFWIRVLMLIV